MILNKKISLITGASGGIGKSILKLFIRKGIFVIGTSTTQYGVDKINYYCGKNGKGYILNLKKIDYIKSFVLKIIKEFGEINILINNAGMVIDKLLVKMKYEDWNNVINVNLNSVFCLSKYIVISMIRKKYGRIVSIGSMIGNTGNSGQVNYSASKAGLIAFSKSLAREVSCRGITVNVVSPGFIISRMTKNLISDYKMNILKNIPLGRFGTTEDIANAVYFLASDKSSYITGETIHVNGGMLMV